MLHNDGAIHLATSLRHPAWERTVQNPIDQIPGHSIFPDTLQRRCHRAGFLLPARHFQAENKKRTGEIALWFNLEGVEQSPNGARRITAAQVDEALTNPRKGAARI
ncbi:protein of unknown function [Methylacidimicrobium sp. AP8]|uniref:hypothetical protein n=1 Tax=Methylacidimicrobium sp. AP8 TaxID=2730359 RepID=UPI0018C13D4A|nr:hypothetical protein [Methylacidimicrobium sp. AP8]CAB4243652.1 protein of unknown function [Methylacidimicrobium sp. AP8]